MRFKYVVMMALFAAIAQLSFVSCVDDDPGAENYYTSTDQYAGDFLRSNPEYSEFVQIVERSNMMNLLNTYGSITVFAPTNKAVENYLHGRGMTSVDELSRADCDTITYTHIIDKMAYFIIDHSSGPYKNLNLLERPLSITTDSTAVVEGEDTVGWKFYYMINRTAQMIQWDDSVANGVVHTMGDVIGAKTLTLPEVLEMDPNVSLFYEALVATHMDDSLRQYVDETYSVGKDSTSWNNDRLCIHTAVEYDNVAYMEHRYFKYTAFCPTNDVFEKYGISVDDPDRIEKMYDLAYKIYGDDEKSFPGVTAAAKDYTNRNNALNRFISYHLLDRYAGYYDLTCFDGNGKNDVLYKYFDSNHWDIADWYETMMPYSIIKASYPIAQLTPGVTGLYINRRGLKNKVREGCRGAKVTKPDAMEYDQTAAVNGIYHYIDDVLWYGKNPTTGQHAWKTLFDERIRTDASTLSPDFMTSGARGHSTKFYSQLGGKYGKGGQGNRAATNVNTCLGFKPGSAKNFYFNDATHVHVRNRVLNFWSYQGDEVTVKGNYDLTIKLPPVPEGTWEVRFFTCIGFASRGIVQFYIDDIPQGIPFDMRVNGSGAGWQDDTSDEEQNAAFDKQFRNMGWMKGMQCYDSCVGGAEATHRYGNNFAKGFRSHDTNLRRIIGEFYSDGHSDHYLRFQQKIDSPENEMNFDCLELCPSSVYKNTEIAEDPY